MKKYLAEMLGTAVLVAMAVGTAVWSESLVAAALAFGLVIVAMAYTIGPISGAHINPAVSLAMFIQKKLSARDFGAYVVAQVVGAVIGALFIFSIISLAGGDATLNTMGANQYEDLADTTGSAIAIALIVEIVLTFVFVFTILGVISKTGNKMGAGLVIGLTLTLVHLIGINLTGTSVNPARSLGPALFAGTEAFRQVWLFILAPLVGAVLAAMAARYFFENAPETSETSETTTAE
ncbi:MAG: aquaporin [Firmicutes bacterium]|nr:aquaporin [Bacillota bacterium]